MKEFRVFPVDNANVGVYVCDWCVHIGGSGGRVGVEVLLHAIIQALRLMMPLLSSIRGY